MVISKGEEKIILLLQQAHIPFEREKTFSDLRKGKYRFDFYIANFGGAPILIEYDGEQHFRQVGKFHKTRADFQKTQEHDRRKNAYALAHGISLYRVPYWDINSITTIWQILQPKYRVTSKFHNDLIRPATF